ncbi:MAG: hypothetical protein WC757_01035 [Candidatus Paceibacterota bacterium]|jgi:hypothetical protein
MTKVQGNCVIFLLVSLIIVGFCMLPVNKREKLLQNQSTMAPAAMSQNTRVFLDYVAGKTISKTDVDEAFYIRGSAGWLDTEKILRVANDLKVPWAQVHDTLVVLNENSTVMYIGSQDKILAKFRATTQPTTAPTVQVEATSQGSLPPASVVVYGCWARNYVESAYQATHDMGRWE